MKPLTNRYGLPSPIVAAIERYASKYDKEGADLSATQLGEPPRIIALKARHGEEIQEDVSDRLYTLDGHIVHEILENAANLNVKVDPSAIAGGYAVPMDLLVPGMIVPRKDSNRQIFFPTLIIEKRFHAVFCDWKVSGQVDLYNPATKTLSDYKRVAVAKRKRGIKDEWVWQLNVLAELMRRNGYEVKAVEAIRWYRDWSLSAKERETDYPPCAIETVPLPLWSSNEATKWIEDRVTIHQLAAMVNDDAELPPCTLEERWNPGPTWAVMKPGAARAARVLPTEPDAAMWLAQNHGKGLEIVERHGENKRCRLYCQVWQWCETGRKEHTGSERPTIDLGLAEVKV